MTMPHQFEPDELLEYETEQPAPPPMATVPVCVDEPVVTVPTVPQHVTCRTYNLTADAPYVQILPQDPLRVRAQIFAENNGIVLCHSLQQAQDPANTADQTFTAPNGALLQANMQVEVSTTQPMWASSSKYPVKVAIIIERRSP